MSNSLKKYIIAGIIVVAFVVYLIYANENATPTATNTSPATPTPTSTTTTATTSTTLPTSANPGFADDLNFNSTGTQVSQLQQLLINKGYLTAISAPTGYFGTLTQGALGQFQAANGISPAVGYFGPITRAFVNAMSSSTITTPTISSGQYKDGTYTGSVTDAFYGKLQVTAVIKNGAIVDVQFLQAPSGGHSSQVSTMAEPVLKQEAITAQSANVNIVSGATQDSEAFQQSLAVALSQAKN